ncbi:hypothetical protein [uncultured Thiodictyon sp.]|uniref:hypothetical protein n=1 Tax=uncultured Thiodictyon sp. TaxID=1846217 RepID=UPI0025DD9FF6|nr:hypothetical protein [uncultured Thiodictyon sp.]
MSQIRASDQDIWKILGLRSAIGIQSPEWELTEGDYWELFNFEPPVDYEGFQHSCDQIKAKWPDRQLFHRLEDRYENA